nr:RNA-directed DNA polymerase, eukaryota, reverse transcriptase zinc-binding domain protein [Tanacetum cinerariifolium]
MGLAVSIEKVEELTRHIGCGILNNPFSFLGSKVGGYMSRIKSWDEVIDKMVKRLSKRKMKTLSIGGSYVGSTTYGIYPVSFFNGNNLDSKRSIWVSWNKVLTSKEKGGLGVSNLFALNRALMFNGFGDFLIKVTRYGLGSFMLYMELMVGLVEREMSDI